VSCVCRKLLNRERKLDVIHINILTEKPSRLLINIEESGFIPFIMNKSRIKQCNDFRELG